MMKNKVEEILHPLITLPLWSIGRAGNLEWFAFGVERKAIPLKDGATKIISEFALHVQCAWRIRRQNKIIVASNDRLYPSGEDPYENLIDFNWDQPGANQLDQRVEKFLKEQGASSLIIDSIHAEEYGDITFSLGNGYFLDVFPNNSIVSEHWRLFKPYSEEEHFVFTNEGISRE